MAIGTASAAATFSVGWTGKSNGEQRLSDEFPGVDFGVLPVLHPVDPSGPAPGRDPIRFGSRHMVTFTAHGTSTPGSLYIRGRDSAQYVIRVFGEAEKTRACSSSILAPRKGSRYEQSSWGLVRRHVRTAADAPAPASRTLADSIECFDERPFGRDGDERRLLATGGRGSRSVPCAGIWPSSRTGSAFSHTRVSAVGSARG